jgi:hypothetical protein
MLDKVELLESYTNKKNRQVYQVIGFATHTETGEDMVIYHSKDVCDVYTLYVRPLELFKEKFEVVS